MHHYFGTKDELFLATIEVPVDIPAMLARIGAQGADGIGPRLVTMILSVWESPMGAGLAAWLRTALTDQDRARMLREFVVGKVAGPFAASLGIPEPERNWRAGLVMTQIIGLIVGRYLLHVEPVVSLTRAQLIASVGGDHSALPDRSAAAGSRPAAAVPSRRTGMSEACRANDQHPRVDARRLIRRRPGGVEVPPRAGQAIDSPRSTWTRPADPRDGVDMSKFHHSAEVRQAWDLRNLRRSQVGRRAERGPE